MPNEEAYVTVGPLHPFPTPTPRWTGHVSLADSSASLVNSNAGSNMMVDGQNRAVEAQNVPAMHDDIGLHAPVVAAEDNATEIANAFEDRYEPVSLLCDEVIPPPKVKSILVKVDRKLFDAPPENSS